MKTACILLAVILGSGLIASEVTTTFNLTVKDERTINKKMYLNSDKSLLLALTNSESPLVTVIASHMYIDDGRDPIEGYKNGLVKSGKEKGIVITFEYKKLPEIIYGGNHYAAYDGNFAMGENKAKMIVLYYINGKDSITITIRDPKSEDYIKILNTLIYPIE